MRGPTTAYGPIGIDRDLEAEADAILRSMALREGKSLRRYGVIDERRQRTVNARELTFSGFFARRRAMVGIEGDS